MTATDGNDGHPHAPSGRLFVALWPDGATRAALAGLARQLGSGRPVAPPNLHLTLAYLGETSATVGAKVVKAIDERLPLPAVALSLTHLGVWPGPRVQWIAPAATPPALDSLHEAIWQAVESCGFKREARPFRPHVTLMRKTREAPPFAVVPAIDWFADRLAVVASVPDPKGVVYGVRRIWSLTG